MKEYYETHVVITAQDMEMIEVLTRIKVKETVKLPIINGRLNGENA